LGHEFKVISQGQGWEKLANSDRYSSGFEGFRGLEYEFVGAVYESFDCFTNLTLERGEGSGVEGFVGMARWQMANGKIDQIVRLCAVCSLNWGYSGGVDESCGPTLDQFAWLAWFAVEAVLR
jgi:hypothetical protein